jgi:hypothetical protein
MTTQNESLELRVAALEEQLATLMTTLEPVLHGLETQRFVAAQAANEVARAAAPPMASLPVNGRPPRARSTAMSVGQSTRDDRPVMGGIGRDQAGRDLAAAARAGGLGLPRRSE